MNHCYRHRLSRQIAVCLTAVLLSSAAATAAPDKIELEKFYEGTQVLRRVFYDRGFTALHSFADLEKNDPKDVILFFLGSTRGIESIPKGVVKFVENGGGVVIATNNHISSDAAAAQIGTLSGLEFRTDVSTIYPNNAAKVCYEGKLHCPFIVPIKGSTFDRVFTIPGSLQLYSRVAANEPCCLVSANAKSPPNENRLAALPPKGAFLERSIVPSFDGEPLFAAGGERIEGRFLLIANHRLFLNRMMLPQDTDNVEFAQNCLSVLAQRKDGQKRKKMLFVEFGNINSEFNIPLKDMMELPKDWPEKVLAGLLGLGEQLPQFQERLARAEENDEFHRGIWRFFDRRGIRGADVLRWVTLTVSGLFALYGLFRLVGPSRYRVDPATPVLPRVVAKHLPRGVLFERRRREMLENNNLWEAARNRARTVLLMAGVAETLPGGRVPKIQVRGGLWQRWRTRRRVRRLWRLAFDATPQLVPKSAWGLVNCELDELKAALASGAVRFV